MATVSFHFLSMNQHEDHTKRDIGDSPQSRDITIGIIVGVVLLLFLTGLFFFLYRYHGSIRLTKKRKDRRYRYGSRSGSGGSGGSSKGSSAGGEAAVFN